MATKEWYTAIINREHKVMTDTRGLWVEATDVTDALEAVERNLSDHEYIAFLAVGKLIDELGQVGMEVCDDA